MAITNGGAPYTHGQFQGNSTGDPISFGMSVKSFKCRLFSFNVLSSSLSEPTFYTPLNPAFLAPAYRWQKLVAKV